MTKKFIGRETIQVHTATVEVIAAILHGLILV